MKAKRTTRSKLSKADKEMDATAYLMRSPANARRLMEGIREIEKGGNVVHKKLSDLIDD